MIAINVVPGIEPVAVDADSREQIVQLNAVQAASLLAALVPAAAAVELPAAAAVLPAAKATSVLEVTCEGRDLLSVDVVNTGAVNALTACVIQHKLSSAGEWRDYFGGADFADAANGNLEFCSTVVPHTLAAAGHSQFKVWVSGAWAVRLLLTSAVGTTVRVSGNVVKS